MIRLYLRTARGNFFENSLPKIAAEALHVRFIRHRYFLAAMRASIIKRRDDNSFHATPRVEFLLSGDLFRRALLQEAARSAIGAFGILTKHHEVDIVNFTIAQRS